MTTVAMPTGESFRKGQPLINPHLKTQTQRNSL